MSAETKMARLLEGPPMSEYRAEYRDGKNPRKKTAAFLTFLLSRFPAGEAWVGAQTPENGMAAEEAYRVPPAESGDVPAVRLHPRGLPWRIARQRARQEAGEPVARTPRRGERT